MVSVPVARGSWLQLECGHQPDRADAGEGEVVDCGACDGRRLPRGLRVARRSPVFDATTLPAALRRAHRTTVWAELVVMAGAVEFRDEDPLNPWSTTATTGSTVTIVPDRPHSVTPSPDAELFVRFYQPVVSPPTPLLRAAQLDQQRPHRS